MTNIVDLIAKYGYQSLALALFLEAIGFPVPAAIALLAAGAAIAGGSMQLAIALPVAAAAMLTADSLLFLAGRYSGWSLLAFLCRVSLNPEVCILRSAKWFYRRGRLTLLVAKFIPGINSMAPPLAGSMNMRAKQFFWLDLMGVLTYVLTYGVIGFLFSGVFDDIVRSLQKFGGTAEWLIAAAIVAYIVYRIWLYGTHRLDRLVRRVKVSDIASRQSDPASPIVIADVRSHGYYDADAQRVRGSIRLEPNNLDGPLEALSKGTPIYLYCT
jgi:membrane protein DedA with SNARE-associated domain